MFFHRSHHQLFQSTQFLFFHEADGREQHGSHCHQNSYDPGDDVAAALEVRIEAHSGDQVYPLIRSFLQSQPSKVFPCFQFLGKLRKVASRIGCGEGRGVAVDPVTDHLQADLAAGIDISGKALGDHDHHLALPPEEQFLRFAGL